MGEDGTETSAGTAVAASAASPSAFVTPEPPAVSVARDTALDVAVASSKIVVQPAATVPVATEIPLSTVAESKAENERAQRSIDARYRWLCVLLVLLCSLGLLVDSATAKGRGIIDANVQLQARRTHNPLSCLPAFIASPSLLAKRDTQWRTPSQVRSLQHALAGKHISFMGDSTVRDLFYQFINLVEGSEQLGVPVTDPVVVAHRLAIRHQSQVYDVVHAAEGGEGGVVRTRVSFHWSPFLANASSTIRTALLSPSSSSASADWPVDVLISTAGFWDLLRGGEAGVPDHAVRRSLLSGWGAHIAGEMVTRGGWRMKSSVWDDRMRAEVGVDEAQEAEARAKELEADGALLEGTAAEKDLPAPTASTYSLTRGTKPGRGYEDWQPRSPTLLWLNSPALIDGRLTGHRMANTRFRDAQVEELNEQVREELVSQLPMLWVDAHSLSALRPVLPADSDDGVHSVWAAARLAEALASFLDCLFPKEEAAAR